MLKSIVTIILIPFVLFLSSCSHTDEYKTELIVSTASSLTNVMTEMKEAYEEVNPDVTVSFNFGGSGKLAQQIIQGAPADLFLSASDIHMNDVFKQDLIDEESIVHFAKNELVLIVNNKSTASINSFSSLHKLNQIAIGEPESVPAGTYAKEVFLHLGIWNQIDNKLVYSKDVRQVLSYVESGNVDAGVVYSTDALLSNKIKVTAKAMEGWHSPIVYPAAIINSSKHPEESKAFLKFLTSDTGKSILQKYNFQTE